MTFDSPSGIPRLSDDRANHSNDQNPERSEGHDFNDRSAQDLIDAQAATVSMDENPALDPALQRAVDRLHCLTVWGRWWVVVSLWLTVGLWSLWQLRKTGAALQEHFTWSAIRVGFVFKPIAAIGLGFCVAVTLSTLLWQSRNILWGLPQDEQQLLQRRVLKIHQQGESHPLWRKVWGH